MTLFDDNIAGLLNEYFPVMADIIFRWDGTLEKYIGDAILAVWGAPFPHDDDADRAVAAAVEMQQALETLNQRWAAENRTQLQIHIGLHSGHVAAGNIGSSRYVQYATIGDATNVASRVCSAAVGGEVFISDATKQLLTHTKVSSDLLPPIQAKGKEQPLRVHRVNWRSGVVVAGPPTERALPAFVVG